MATLRDVMIYFCSNYPHPDELSKARLAKMAYLADWRSAIMRGEQITATEWVFNHYGPYVREVEEIAASDESFNVERTTNVYGSDKDLVRIRTGAAATSLTDDERAVLDFVIDTTAPMYWADFLKLIYSTYPILTQPRLSKLDLVSLAHEYEEDRQRFAWGPERDMRSTNHAPA